MFIFGISTNANAFLIAFISRFSFLFRRVIQPSCPLRLLRYQLGATVSIETQHGDMNTLICSALLLSEESTNPVFFFLSIFAEFN